MKRSPIKRRTRIRRVSKARLRTRDLDKLARDAVFARDSICMKCGKVGNLQWCHVYSRRYLSMRWDPDNSMVLCAGCHLWWHHKPLEAARWFELIYPERAKRLLLISRTKRRPDLAAVRLGLEQMLK